MRRSMAGILYADFAREKVIPWGWEGDGILAWLGAGDDLAEFVQSRHKPTVDFSFRRPQLKFPPRAGGPRAGRPTGGRAFSHARFHQLMFYSDADNWSYEERGDGFVKALARAGHTCAWLRWLQSADLCHRHAANGSASANGWPPQMKTSAQAAGRFRRQ